MGPSPLREGFLWRICHRRGHETSIMHDAVIETDETRYILMFRVWHPDLTDAERGALQMIYDYLEVPDLLSSDATI